LKVKLILEIIITDGLRNLR